MTARPPRRILVLIPARAGSRRLRHKNIRRLGGVPLLVRAIHLAQASQRRGESWDIVVSTDSADYARLARRAGASVPALRPRRLSGANARLVDVLAFELERYRASHGDPDVVLMLSATTPLSTAADVRAVLAAIEGQVESAVAIRADPAHPALRCQRDRRGRLHGPKVQIGPRHLAPQSWVVAGSIYAATPGWLAKKRQFVIWNATVGVAQASERAVDVETELDLLLCEQLLRRQGDTQRLTRRVHTGKKLTTFRGLSTE